MSKDEKRVGEPVNAFKLNQKCICCLCLHVSTLIIREKSCYLLIHVEIALEMALFWKLTFGHTFFVFLRQL